MPIEYSIVMADPPWEFNRSGDTKRTADSHYPTMNMNELGKLGMQLERSLSPRAALFLWTTNATIPESMALFQRWGFKFVTVAFVWVKITNRALPDRELRRAIAEGERVIRYDDGYHRMHFGMGSYTRAQAEFCFLGKRGDMPVEDHGVPQVIYAPVREHSRKPDEAYTLIQRMYPNRAYLELFARQRRPGWAAFGNEVDKFTE